MHPVTRLLCLSFLLVMAGVPAAAAGLNEKAPSFTLKNTAKENRALASYKGKIVLINFWASWCAPCQTELPELNALANEYKDSVKVLAINVDADPSLGRKALKRLRLEQPRMEILWDTRSRVVKTYDIPTMPSSYVIDQGGRIRFIHEGFRPGDREKWRHEIATLREKQ